MSAETQPQRTLHDRLFKEFLYRFLPDFLWIFFPAEAERLNFATLRFLDKELIINFSGQELRITDLVAEVETWDGVPEAIILHVEVEGRDKQALPQRMSEYYVLLRIFRKKFVLPLALVLLPGAGGLDWHTYSETSLVTKSCVSSMGKWAFATFPAKRTWWRTAQWLLP